MRVMEQWLDGFPVPEEKRIFVDYVFKLLYLSFALKEQYDYLVRVMEQWRDGFPTPEDKRIFVDNVFKQMEGDERLVSDPYVRKPWLRIRITYMRIRI